jgi:hypothetical protein
MVDIWYTMNGAQGISNIELLSILNVKTLYCKVFVCRLPKTFVAWLSSQQHGALLVKVPFRLHVILLGLVLSSWEREITEDQDNLLRDVGMAYKSACQGCSGLSSW